MALEIARFAVQGAKALVSSPRPVGKPKKKSPISLVSIYKNDLKYGDSQWQVAAAHNLAGVTGSKARPAIVRALEKNLLQVHVQNSDEVIQATIALIELIGRFGRTASAAVPTLIEALYHPDATVQSAAIRVLGRMGPAAKEAVPHLLHLIKENFSESHEPNLCHQRFTKRVFDQSRHVQTVDALTRIGPVALPYLSKSLHFISTTLDEHGGSSLNWIGKIISINELYMTLSRPVKLPPKIPNDVLIGQQRSIGSIIRQIALNDMSGFIKVMESPNIELGSLSVLIDEIQFLYNKAAPLAPFLTKLLNDPKWQVIHLKIVHALLKIAPGAEAAIFPLARIVLNRNATVELRIEAVKAIGIIGVTSPMIGRAVQDSFKRVINSSFEDVNLKALAKMTLNRLLW